MASFGIGSSVGGGVLSFSLQDVMKLTISSNLILPIVQVTCRARLATFIEPSCFIGAGVCRCKTPNSDFGAILRLADDGRRRQRAIIEGPLDVINGVKLNLQHDIGLGLESVIL